MLKDVPYSTLKKNERTYKIMLLRDQYNNTFSEIAKEYEISTARVVQIYNRLKTEQICLYINHIAIVSGHSSTSQIKKVLRAAYECYQDAPYVCAYLEKQYSDILNKYRGDEPGMPTQLIQGIPPFRHKLSKKTIARVIEMREIEKASFITIATELRLTQSKAKHTYEAFYHKQVLKLIKALQKKAKNEEEKSAIWWNCFSRNKNSHSRYHWIIKEYALQTSNLEKENP